MRAYVLTAAIVVAASGCKIKDDQRPAVAGGSATSAATGAGSGSGASTAAADTAVAVDPAMLAFCLRTMEQIKKCFQDEAFWDAHATTYFAALKEPIDPERKQHWIGMYKDSFVSLARAKELEQNCRVMLEQNQLPTQKQMDLVDGARQQSCVAFGGALGYVLFSEGAFYRPRDGTIPMSLELVPQR